MNEANKEGYTTTARALSAPLRHNDAHFVLPESKLHHRASCALLPRPSLDPVHSFPGILRPRQALQCFGRRQLIKEPRLKEGQRQTVNSLAVKLFSSP